MVRFLHLKPQACWKAAVLTTEASASQKWPRRAQGAPGPLLFAVVCITGEADNAFDQNSSRHGRHSAIEGKPNPVSLGSPQQNILVTKSSHIGANLSFMTISDTASKPTSLMIHWRM